jgi:hypothetical protein
VLLGGKVIRELYGEGVHHGDQLDGFSGSQEVKVIGTASVGLEGEASGDVKLPIDNNPLVILVDDHSDLLPLRVLCRHVDAILPPVGVQFYLHFLRD